MLACVSAILAGRLIATQVIETQWLIVLAISPLILILSIRHVDWIYYALLFTLPVAAQGLRLPFITLSLTDVLTLLICAVLIGQRITQTTPPNQRRDLAPLVVLCAWFILASLVTSFSTIYLTETLRRIIAIVGQVLLVWITISVLTSKDRLAKALTVIMVSGVATAAIALLQSSGMLGPILGAGYVLEGRSIGGIDLPGFRASGLFQGLGPFVVWLLLAFSLISLGWTAVNSRVGWAIRFLSLSVLMGGLVVSQTRGGWIAFLFLVVGLVLSDWWRKLNQSVVFGLYITVVFSMWGATTILGSDFADVAAPLVDMHPRSFYTRLSAYSMALRMVGESPLFGYGVRAFGVEFANEFGKFKLVHNTFLSVLVAYGLVGLLPFLGLLFGALWRAIPIALDKGRHAILSNWTAALIVAMIAVLIESHFFEAVLDKTLWLLVGLLWALPNIYSIQDAAQPSLECSRR